MAFFSKTNVMIKYLPKLAVVWAKNAIVHQIFGENIFLNDNIGWLTI
jgi:hypothetical protein